MLSSVRPGWAEQVKQGDILVAGRNFGTGSSRPAPTLLRRLGIVAIVCESVAEIFQRNCVSYALPALDCPGCLEMTTEGDTVTVDLDNGTYTNVTTGVTGPGRCCPPCSARRSPRAARTRCCGRKDTCEPGTGEARGRPGRRAVPDPGINPGAMAALDAAGLRGRARPGGYNALDGDEAAWHKVLGTVRGLVIGLQPVPRRPSPPPLACATCCGSAPARQHRPRRGRRPRRDRGGTARAERARGRRVRVRADARRGAADPRGRPVHPRRRMDPFPGRHLGGRTLGLIGYGEIAQLMVPKARGFDMDVSSTGVGRSRRPTVSARPAALTSCWPRPTTSASTCR